ncbi:unnamed protein product [Polarella glacialis]|uniref:Uncharacterized protein n=1 Tax=Polarella glacialis TaxID=89957 RepID=A0A813E3C1_POLGL|nr:unnamed protein product [Polarella glacialis]
MSAAMSAAGSRSNALEQFALAGVSNGVASFFTNPVDVLKVRMQLAGASAFGTANCQLGVVGSAKAVLRKEGLAVLYLGMQPSLLREIPYGGLRMGMYEPVREQLAAAFASVGSGKQTQSALGVKVVAGAITGAVGSIIACPMDLIKVRMQGGTRAYASVLSAAREIMLEGGGVKCLWRGSGPTVQRAALLTATQVPCYDHSKHHLLSAGLIQEGYVCHFLCSMVAGVAAAAATTPVDLAKSRIMSQTVDATGRGTLYNGTFECLMHLAKEKGTASIFRGFNMQWLRIGPHTTISLMCFEQLRRLVGMNYL